jgi:hypothetical protein
MSVTNFLFDTVTIKEISTTLSSWEETIIETVIYNEIPCKFYELSNTLKQTKESKQTSQSSFRCIITADRVNIRDWMLAIVSSPLAEVWKFTIAWTRLLKKVDRTGSHIEFDLNDKFLTR